MLELNSELAARINAHGAKDYPHECCGALLGTDGAAGRAVRDLLPLSNRRDDSPRNRFAITAEDVRAAERAATERGLDLIGWYHSHPDHPARPSEFDREHAWPWYSYIIVAVAAGVPREMTSWRLTDDRARFEAEPISPAAAAGAAAQTSSPVGGTH
ncbi:MAG: M67 family metallopeptidase [Candidatus Acidiferrales bacterium]|jgi:proteasome lid subunit RPN8/RPN11